MEHIGDDHLVSLENIQTDVQDLTRGLENAKKELIIRQNMKVFTSILSFDISNQTAKISSRMLKPILSKNFFMSLKVNSIV